jgi:hypothetical protein
MWLWTGGVDKTNMSENGPLTSHSKSEMKCRVYKSLAKAGGGVVCVCVCANMSLTSELLCCIELLGSWSVFPICKKEVTSRLNFHSYVIKYYFMTRKP